MFYVIVSENCDLGIFETITEAQEYQMYICDNGRVYTRLYVVENIPFSS